MVENNKVAPLVSVLMTSYNREAYIAEAIESVINSTYQNWELIICDDCSTDNTVLIARGYEMTNNNITVYINENNLGDYHNRNKAASYAKGKYLKYVDSDDYIYPHTLEVMVGGMELYPDAALGISSSSSLFTKGMFLKHDPESAYYFHFFIRNVLNNGPSGVIMKRDVFFTLEGFSGKRNISDFEMWLKMGARYAVVEMEYGLVYWRQHAGQESDIVKHIYLEQLYNVLRNALDDPYCPLNKKEKIYLLRDQKKNTLKGILMESVNRKSLNYLRYILRINNLRIVNFIALPFYYLTTIDQLPLNSKWDNKLPSTENI